MIFVKANFPQAPGLLREKGVEVEKKTKELEFGKFGWINGS